MSFIKILLLSFLLYTPFLESAYSASGEELRGQEEANKRRNDLLVADSATRHMVQYSTTYKAPLSAEAAAAIYNKVAATAVTEASPDVIGRIISSDGTKRTPLQIFSSHSYPSDLRSTVVMKALRTYLPEDHPVFKLQPDQQKEWLTWVSSAMLPPCLMSPWSSAFKTSSQVAFQF